MHFRLAAALFAFALALPASPSGAETTCAASDFAAAVDASGASLRTFTLEAQPKLQERMRRYREALKLADTDYENAALDAIQDTKLESLDARSSELIMKIDSLGRVPDGATPDCSKLAEIKSASGELLTVIKEKSDHMLQRLDAKIVEAGGAAKPQKQAEAPKAPAAEPPPAPKPAPKPPEAWATATKPNDAYKPAPLPETAMPPVSVTSDPPGNAGYTIDEIREATRGFFGTISTNLASVIEYAFKQSGQPTAYVLGTEGGGAFLAGLRYGQGTLYMRNDAATRKVYWHGPSVGTDFGASGSRTMFLIYKMREPNALYRSFTGVDGSAYFVGGVGVTLLKGGEVLMAPIRSGIGLRLGANLGYLRFTDHATWNPF